MANINITRRGGGASTNYGKTLHDLNEERMTEAYKWISDEMKTALELYAQRHADILSQSAGIGSLKLAHMFCDQRVADLFNFSKPIDGARAEMTEACRVLDEKWFPFIFERKLFEGGTALDVSPPRVPHVWFYTWYRVRIAPRERTVINRFLIDKVYSGFYFSQWSNPFALIGEASTS